MKKMLPVSLDVGLESANGNHNGIRHLQRKMYEKQFPEVDELSGLSNQELLDLMKEPFGSGMYIVPKEWRKAIEGVLRGELKRRAKERQ